jgi:A/G-specific adenine glycosylase
MKSNKSITRFRREVWNYYRAYGRETLPWRKTKDPYKILVSEIMLQQTQVPRVVEKYKEFLKAFPTVQSLARQDLASVVRAWSGMGYNRRAKYLKQMAEIIVKEQGGKIPKDFATLRSLPGIGTYTASAVRVFAYNLPDVLIETNVRAVYIHHFCKGQSFAGNMAQNIGADLQRTVLCELVSDKELLPIIQNAAQDQDPREWHWALMDYGSHLKKLHKNPARKSATYKKQSKFEGSVRQVRGAILLVLQGGPQTEKILSKKVSGGVASGYSNATFEKAIEGLEREGMVVKKKGRWGIA